MTEKLNFPFKSQYLCKLKSRLDMKTFMIIGLLCCSIIQTVTAQKDEYFGKKINSKNSIALSNVSNDLALGDTITVKLTGTISSVCKKKGCWMTLNDVNTSNEVFVRFKDYGFFVPLDCDGRQAIVEGKLFTHFTSVDELRHYAEDKGKSKEEIAKITEPEKEIRMIADGVLLMK